MRLARKNDPLCPVVRRPGRPAGKEHFLMIPGRQVYRFFSTLFFFLFFNRTHQFCIRQTGIRDGEKACPRRWCDGVSFCTNTALRIAGYAKRKKEIFVPKNFTGAVVCEAFQPSIRGGDWQHYRLFFFSLLIVYSHLLRWTRPGRTACPTIQDRNKRELHQPVYEMPGGGRGIRMFPLYRNRRLASCFSTLCPVFASSRL